MADVRIPVGRWSSICAHAYYLHIVLSSDADLKDINMLLSEMMSRSLVAMRTLRELDSTVLVKGIAVWLLLLGRMFGYVDINIAASA